MVRRVAVFGAGIGLIVGLVYACTALSPKRVSGFQNTGGLCFAYDNRIWSTGPVSGSSGARTQVEGTFEQTGDLTGRVTLDDGRILEAHGDPVELSFKHTATCAIE